LSNALKGDAMQSWFLEDFTITRVFEVMEASKGGFG